MIITHVTQDQIDRTRWDRCVQQASNARIYGETSFLDHLCDHWDGLIINDYESVMPVPWKQKWGIPYVIQPAFYQQGGLFGKHATDYVVLEHCIQHMRSRFRFAETTLNSQNLANSDNRLYSLAYRQNFVLDIRNTFEQIELRYSSYLAHRIRRSQKNELTIRFDLPANTIIQEYQQRYARKIKDFTPTDFARFTRYCNYLKSINRLHVLSVHTTEGEWIAGAILLCDQHRLYNAVSCLKPDGKKQGANYFLYDQVIRTFSGKNLLLDFEGSDIPGIAYFYEKFGGEKEWYPFIRYNQLPRIIRYLKKG
ncbi:MAG: hypothetical protein ACKO5C_06195 [Ferruginibacter sp.]